MSDNLHDPACCCERGQDIDGPDESCPWHGNPMVFYREAERLRKENVQLQERLGEARWQFLRAREQANQEFERLRSLLELAYTGNLTPYVIELIEEELSQDEV